MRRRLVVAFVALTVLVVTLYGVPRALIRADQIEEREQEQVEKSAQLLSALVESEFDSGRPVTDALLAPMLRSGERLEYVASDGATVAAGDPAGRDVAVTSTVSVPGGGSLTLDYSEEAIDERVQDALLPLLYIGLMLIALAWFAARALARRLSTPFQDLAEHARTLGSGRFDLDIPHYDIPEAEAVGQALSRSAHDLDVLVRREREFAVNASHELRTPLTAARLRLEGLVMWDATPPEVTAELEETLEELTRLDCAVASLLEQDRVGRSAGGVDMDIDALVTAVAGRWQSKLESKGRSMTIHSGEDCHTRLLRKPVEEVLDLLFGCTVDQGAGDVVVETTPSPAYVEVRFADQSPSPPDTAAAGSQTSSDLSRAVELAASVGGHLARGPGPSTSYVLRLPVVATRLEQAEQA
ncbi:HAMP domain-containing histidine kinase [Nocardioides piscis]|uniref:histidine kinase n=1 Tax=Nocardioides piscis TaxID=2714938 RepID=A0A6G7YGN8_9ACTN|nr:HAMP domain-containing histidine kinase [Nocardioides piscis]QIK75801.1 HAMP domain-containing histidine kinase [Nocardioides piscis]